jgi:hypothetical protein
MRRQHRGKTVAEATYFPNLPSAASIEKPIHNVKVRRSPERLHPCDRNRTKLYVVHSGTCRHDGSSGDGGAYRDRTDDPLLAKQVLSQLS